ncbi:MAG: hypothetical protein ACKOFX_02060, partial [Solirubrobacterales bacterium]
MSTAEGRETAGTAAGIDGEAWLSACRRMVAGQKVLFEEAVTIDGIKSGMDSPPGGGSERANEDPE